MQVQRAVAFIAVLTVLGSAVPNRVWAQAPVQETEIEKQARRARRGGGIRAGFWNSDVAPETSSRSVQLEGYFQRGLDRSLALESSVSVWRAIATSPQGVETRAYVIPLLTSLKFFPITEPGDAVEPFVLAGIGFALGLEDQDATSIGGSGTSVVTGFAFRGAAGLELSMTRGFGLSISGKYQWVRFGEPIINTETFSGLGLEGGVIYRFQP